MFYWATLGDRSYEFLFEPKAGDEVVALDCETTGLNPRVDDIVAIAAVRIKGNRILLSGRFQALIRPETMLQAGAIKVHGLRERDVAAGRPMHQILPELLHFIGGQPLVGYYIDFDVQMLNKYILPYIQTKLPNPLIEVSRLYYERKYRGAPPEAILDLSFTSILADLGIPPLEQHDALNDAVMAGMMYLQLRDLKARNERIVRPRSWLAQTPPVGA